MKSCGGAASNLRGRPSAGCVNASTCACSAWREKATGRAIAVCAIGWFLAVATALVIGIAYGPTLS